MVTQQRLWPVYLMLAFATSTWGSAFVAGRFATETFDPVTVSFLRFFFAALILIPMMMILEKDRPKPSKTDWLLLISLGLTGIAIYNIAFFTAAKYAPIVKSSLFIASNPVLIILLSGLFLKETITKRNVTGLVLALTGAVIIITNGQILATLRNGLEPIDLVLLFAVICWALYSVLGKVALKKFSALTSTTYAVTIGTLMLMPFAVYETSWSQVEAADWVVWSSILHMSIIVTVISFLMYYQGIKIIGAAKASLFINLMPVSAVILAVIFLDEPLLLAHIIGAMFVFTGVTVGTRTKPLWIHQQKRKARKTAS
ncbi:DMT family transporter [Alteribacter salitolerans]|uniref:DMT family transporter n=1 Tax=Alteribacter salitolerans TaxID=2912333 RepID=UPI001F17911A|nr:DMT family transporter [Alteribacter salitolerans]